MLVVCSSLSHHRHFVGFELDAACYAHAAPIVVLRSAATITLRTTDNNLLPNAIPGASDVHQFYEAHRMQDPKLSALTGLPQYQRMPRHLIAHLAPGIGMELTSIHEQMHKGSGS